MREYIGIKDVYLEVNNIKFTEKEVMKINKDIYDIKQYSKCFLWIYEGTSN